jgi:hypothetical protein
MTDIEKLLAIEEIKLLRYRWSRFVDEGSWGQIAQLLAADAELDLSATRRLASGTDIPPVKGSEAICRWLEEGLGRVPDQLHIVTMPEITFLSDSQAEGIWRQESHIPAMAGHDGKAGIGYGTIRDGYRKIDGRWLMHRMGVSVDLVL